MSKNETIPVADAKSIEPREVRVTPVTPIEQATATSLLADIIYRGIALLVVCGIFVGLNYLVMNFVNAAFAQDVELMKGKPPIDPSQRLVDAKVIMSLIGATVVQTGIGFISVLSYLFPKKP